MSTFRVNDADGSTHRLEAVKCRASPAGSSISVDPTRS
jgi:hypothetical protein